MNSTIFPNSAILTQEQSKNLVSLTGFQANLSYHLIYQASRDGFGQDDFHSKCDGIKKRTLIVIKSSNGNVFGGYTEADWGSSYYGNSYSQYDSNAFIFSLINEYNFPLKMNVTNPYNSIQPSGSGSIFGGYYFCYSNRKSDINIGEYSNKNNFSSTNPGNNYKLPSYLTLNVPSSQSYLAGSSQFQTVDIEAYLFYDNRKLIFFIAIKNVKLFILHFS